MPLMPSGQGINKVVKKKLSSDPVINWTLISKYLLNQAIRIWIKMDNA